ncbi:Protein rogdi like protein [Turdus rufiventris]|nr:Protein rogdi like protein [Turdus rufiventris]
MAAAAAAMASQGERAVLEEEFKWLLQEEVHAVLKQLQDILKEASHRFALPTSGSGGPVKQENFVLSTSGTDQVKGVMTLQGDALCQADVNLKMPRNNQLLHFAFREDKQWKLQQIQDARNHVNQAIYLLMNRDVNYQFKTGLEVLKLMDAVMLQLSRARNRLTTPATLTLPEIASSGLTKMFTPALPPDILVNFYINLNKLCFIIYQLHILQPSTTKNFKPTGGSVLHNPGAMFEFGSQRYEVSHVHKVECVVPWLNDALVFFTVSLQLCQQLKDKVTNLHSKVSYSTIVTLGELFVTLKKDMDSEVDEVAQALLQMVERQVPDPVVQAELIKEMAQRNANEACRRVILSLHLEPAPSLAQMIKACARKAELFSAPERNPGPAQPKSTAAVTPGPRKQPVPPQQLQHITYFQCKKTEHYGRDCPHNQKQKTNKQKN